MMQIRCDDGGPHGDTRSAVIGEELLDQEAVDQTEDSDTSAAPQTQVIQ